MLFVQDSTSMLLAFAVSARRLWMYAGAHVGMELFADTVQVTCFLGKKRKTGSNKKLSDTVAGNVTLS